MIEFWHWWVIAVALAVVEIWAPGAAFLWLGVAAGMVGVVLLVYPGLGWEGELLLFAVLAIAAVLAGRAVYRRAGLHAAPNRLNRRAEQYIGTLHTLETAIVNGHGRAHVGDTSWSVQGPDLPAGATVRVVAVDGVILKVEKA
ncbi:NfeD family protein [Azospirillum sp.]|uniref:NfeD family protein n=1 Tax=Azospirillum sp. TaxID=34012 RepID=UPI003D7113CD